MAKDVERIKYLVKFLNKASEAYYKYDNPIMSDKEFDDLYDELVILEDKTGIILNNSPTQNVGGEIISELKKYSIQDQCYLQIKQKTLQK